MYPSYLNLSKKDLNLRIGKLFKNLENCEICPRKCRANRLGGKEGFCKLGGLPMVSAHHPHFGEESVLVGTHGSVRASLHPVIFLAFIVRITRFLN